MAIHKIEVPWKNGTMIISNSGLKKWDSNHLTSIDFQIKDDRGKEMEFSIDGDECEELAKYFTSLLTRFSVPINQD